MIIKNSSSIPEIASELGDRLKQARLNKNISQEQLRKLSGVSRKMIAQAENGEGNIKVFIHVLKALELVEQLNNFIPPVPVSPIQLAKLAGKKRQRASGNSDVDTSGGGESW